MRAIGTANYAYVVARVRHRRSALFGEEEYRKLLRMGPGGIARFMEDTEYGAEITDLGARYDGVDLIEYALNANIAKHFDDLLRWSNGRLYDLVARYLRKFDAWNAKTVLRGIYSEATEEEIRADLIDAGEFDEAFLDSLVAADSIEAATDLLADTTIGHGIEDAYAEYEETELLVPLENAIDRAYYERLAGETLHGGRAIELYEQFLEAEIDFRNMRNALRIERSGADIDPAEYFIEGGSLFDAGEIRSLAGNRDELLARIRESRYGEDLSEAIDDLESAESLIDFEHALDGAIVSYADYLSHVYPLSVCPVLAYVVAKEREVNNIRAIARGLEAGLEREQIEAELVNL
ncbi:MAG: V-type ATP synthase subunit C [Halobacteriota archaeon]